MLDSKGVLNPGLMPRTLDDLRLIAPRDGLDAHRVSLWNRVAEVWRQQDDFRKALLGYATRSDHGDDGERRPLARSRLPPDRAGPLAAHVSAPARSDSGTTWSASCSRVPVAGVRLDRMMIIAIPLEVAEQLDLDLSTFVDEPEIGEEETSSSEMPATEPQARRPFYVGGVIPREEPPADDDAPQVKVMVPLAPAEPFLFTQNILRNLWEEADRRAGPIPRGCAVPHRTIPVGPYELAVIPTGGGRSAIRAGSAVRAVLQGMQQRGKQIEIFTPSALARISGSRTVIAIWIYQDASMAIGYVDFQYKERYILWHAPGAVQFNYDYLEELRARLSAMNLQIPDQIDRIVSGK